MLILRRFLTIGHNRIWVKMSDSLTPPENVRGMKVLDRNKFIKVVKVPCIYTPIERVKSCLGVLKSYLLKLNCFKPVQNTEAGRMLYLDPRKVKGYTSFDEGVRHNLEEMGFTPEDITFKDIQLNYDNWKLYEIIRAVTPECEESVSSYSQIGHIVHLNLRPHMNDYKGLIGRVILDKVPNSRTVISKVDTITNEFRKFEFEVLAGESDFIAKVQENKCKFELDFSQVYWNPRLSTEHSLVVDYLSKGDVLFDVFAGIGPFAVPSAKKGVTVFANDLNSHSIRWLRRNVELNKAKSITVVNKDGNLFIQQDFKEKFLNLEKGDYKILIVMNLPALATQFLHNFIGLFDNKDKERITELPTPVVFVYCFVKNAEDEVKEARRMVLNEIGMEELIGEPHFVRNVAPNKYMFRISVRLTPELLVSKKRTLNEELEPNKKPML